MCHWCASVALRNVQEAALRTFVTFAGVAPTGAFGPKPPFDISSSAAVQLSHYGHSYAQQLFLRLMASIQDEAFVVRVRSKVYFHGGPI